MKKLLKPLIYFHVLIALIILFLPKYNLYYALEEVLQEQKVYLSNETIIDRGFSLDVQNPDIAFEQLSLAQVDNIKISIWGFANGVRMENIHINDDFVGILPLEIDKIQVINLLYNPMVLDIKGESSEGFFFGSVDLLERKLLVHVRLDAAAQKKYPGILSRLTSEEGGHYFEYQF